MKKSATIDITSPLAFLKQVRREVEMVGANDAYTWDMVSWHAGSPTTCCVCLAGAVMAGRWPRHRTTTPGRFANTYEHGATLLAWLLALDEVRKGCGDNAAWAFYPYPGPQAPRFSERFGEPGRIEHCVTTEQLLERVDLAIAAAEAAELEEDVHD